MTELLQYGPALVDRPTTALDTVEAFLVRLMSTPLAEWHRLATIATAPDQSTATRALEEATRTPDTLYLAWLVRDRVETACHRFDSPEGRHACPGARRSDLRLSTERAALALLVRASLREDHFEALCGGFAPALTPSSPSAPPP